MYYNKKVIMNYDNTIASVFTIMDVIEPLLYSLHTCDSLITISTKFRLMDYINIYNRYWDQIMHYYYCVYQSTYVATRNIRRFLAIINVVMTLQYVHTIASVLIRVQYVSILTVALVATNSVVTELRAVAILFITFSDI